MILRLLLVLELFISLLMVCVILSNFVMLFVVCFVSFSVFLIFLKLKFIDLLCFNMSLFVFWMRCLLK